MIKIELTPYEKKDLIDVLNFAKEQYEEIYDDKRIPKYWIMRIEELKKILEGKVNPPSLERRK